MMSVNLLYMCVPAANHAYAVSANVLQPERGFHLFSSVIGGEAL